MRNWLNKRLVIVITLVVVCAISPVASRGVFGYLADRARAAASLFHGSKPAPVIEAKQCESTPKWFTRLPFQNNGPLVPKECVAPSLVSKGTTTPKALEVIRGGAHADEVVQPLFGLSDAMLKIILQLILSGINVSSWLIPLRMANFTKHKKLIGIANAFSGGVFLAMALGHMIPHAQQVFLDLGMSPMCALYATIAGYLTIFFVERIAFDHHHSHDDDDDDKHAHTHTHAHANGHTHSSSAPTQRSAGILVLALAVHSLFETMALGLSDGALTTVLLAASIGLHQPAESIALLVTLLKTGMDKASIAKWLAIFSMVGPVGVMTGMFVNKVAPPFMDALVVGLAAGTFIFVGTTEIIPEEFENTTTNERWSKFLALLGGVGSILAITRFTADWEQASAHPHSHGPHFH